MANSINICNKLPSSAVFHSHPISLIATASHIKINNSYKELNKILYTQKEGLVTNIPELIGLTKYEPSGSKALIKESLAAINNHRVVIWGHHGVLIREKTIERCVDLLEYVEDAASFSLRALLNPKQFTGLNFVELQKSIKLYKLNPAILEVLRSK